MKTVEVSFVSIPIRDLMNLEQLSMVIINSNIQFQSLLGI